MKKIVRDWTRAAASGGGSGRQNRGRSSSHKDHPGEASSEVAELRNRVAQMEDELVTAKDAARLQKEQLDKSLLEYTAALQRIVSLEKMIASKADVEEQNEQLQEKVIELIGECQSLRTPVVETQTLGRLSVEEAAMIIDGKQEALNLGSPPSVVELMDGSEQEATTTRIHDLESRLSKFVVFEDPLKPGRQWCGERRLREYLIAVCAENTRLKALRSSPAESAAGTGIDGDLRGNGAFHPRCRTVDPDGDSSGGEIVPRQTEKGDGVHGLEDAAVGNTTMERRPTESAKSIRGLERHLIRVLEDYLMQREAQLDRALGLSLASKMIGSAVYSSDDGGPADESAAMEELVTELRQEITVKNNLCDQLALRLADYQSADARQGWSQKTENAILAL
ncbi:hypothetical protein Pmar_PMAR018033 [Perkinsus marinus ATCC 50983]|uniref:Uncharacterized protein n=1 Tax=Perkinsus marinus (strain ATCC 50983 / TXsc) TaxID=423536 RepID=C5KRT8_PERM5|nr:hypothetical protein Pmar_PMAR018033 [Perkinsus marinus ATCC 50983]EER12779.1 hypothetical protein Pmar_PMAR018033 [Perkinsus marinus ATCC 50983]|eukprot:XP_002780984.1 hypothetical protein Pmar_PMAR018033 [Perkinsus marinus ATCC 50983]